MSKAGPLGSTIDEADPVKEFAARLRQLQTESGGPSVRTLVSLTRAIGVPFTRGTIQDKLTGRTTPDWTFVEAFVRACALHDGVSGEPDLGPWWDWHQQMLRDIAARRAGQRRAGEAVRALGIGSDSGPTGTAPVGRAYRIAELTPDPVPLPQHRLLSRQPSWLLAARHRVVPFIGRIAELAELARWRDDPWPRLSVMLVHGTGGQGKTRLADEFARHTAELGSWAVRVGTHQTAARPRPRQAEVTTAAGDESVAAPARRDPVSGALADLAMSLNNLGAVLSALGRREDALAPSQEAVTIYQRLAETNPAAYLSNLATSLSNLGAILSALGRREDALAPSQEAVTIHRRLVETNPAAYLSNLATSLSNLGAMLSALGRHEDALALGQEAVDIHRRLAETNPAAYLSDLATSLSNLGLGLSDLGRREDALAPSQEAVTIYKRLAETNPTAYLPNLATSLNNLGTMLAALGRHKDALAPSQEAVTIHRRLAEANPAAYLPDLAMSLWGYAWVSVKIGLGLFEALAAVQEAIGIYRPLAEQWPEVFGAKLWSAFHTLADVFDSLGRFEEATDLRRRLAQTVGDLGDEAGGKSGLA